MIRHATTADHDAIIRMLKSYQHASPLEFHKKTTPEQAYKMLLMIDMNMGVCFVSEDSAGIHGMIMAVLMPNIWDKDVYALHEVAYWVDINRRGTTAAHRLLKAYCTHAEMLKSAGKIEYYTISKMITSPNLDYSRFGFTPLEEQWKA